MKPNSINKLIEASKKAIEGIKEAPSLNKDFVEASAEKLQELIKNLKKSAQKKTFYIVFSHAFLHALLGDKNLN